MPLDWRPPGGKRPKTQVSTKYLPQSCDALHVHVPSQAQRCERESDRHPLCWQSPVRHRPCAHPIISLDNQPPSLDSRRGLARTAVTDSGGDSIGDRSGRGGGPGGASGGGSGGGGEGCIGTAAAGLQWLERQQRRRWNVALHGVEYGVDSRVGAGIWRRRLGRRSCDQREQHRSTHGRRRRTT